MAVGGTSRPHNVGPKMIGFIMKWHFTGVAKTKMLNYEISSWKYVTCYTTLIWAKQNEYQS